MKNRILYIGNFDLKPINSSGSRVVGVAKILKKIDFDVTLVNASTLDKSSISTGVYEGFNYETLLKPKSILSYFNVIYQIKSIKKILNKHLEIGNLKCLILYGSTSTSFTLLYIRYWCRVNKVKYVTDCVDWLSATNGSLFFRLFKFVDTYIQKAIINKSSDGLIVISSFLQKYYNNKTTIIIPPVKYVTSKVFINNIETKKLSFVYAGKPFPLDGRNVNISSYKDRLDLVIDGLYFLYKKGFEFQFDIYGLTKEEYLKVVSRHKTHLQEMSDDVSFFGYIEMNELESKMSQYDFSFLIRDKSKLTEAGFSTKLVESTVYGVPVITTDTSDITKYFKHELNCLIFDVTSQKKLEDSFIKLTLLKNIDINQMKKECLSINAFNPDLYSETLSEFLIKIL